MPMMSGFANAFKIEELRKKIFVTLGIVFVCRLISMIPCPGVDWGTLQSTLELARQNRESAGVAGLLSLFTGGALDKCAIGFLSIWPYISAQIVIQLLSSVIPSLEKYKREGESGRTKLAEITRYLTIVICIFQAWGISAAMMHPEQILGSAFAGKNIVISGGVGFQLMTVLSMTTASLFVMWLADQITTFGIGNGASMIIMINIASRLPTAIVSLWNDYFGPAAHGNWVMALILLLIGFSVVMGTVVLIQGVRKVPIHAARRSMTLGSSYGMQQTYMPLRVNYTGVMPIIFAQPLIQIPAYLLGRIGTSSPVAFLGRFGRALQSGGATYMVVYAILIMFFAFFWVATQFNAVKVADDLKKSNSYIPGIRPGRATAEFLDALMTRITLIGGTGLMIVALIPGVLMSWLHIHWEVASFFGGTSLLIIVGVALDTLRIMESHLLVRKYEGFLRHGSIQGRRG